MIDIGTEATLLELQLQMRYIHMNDSNACIWSGLLQLPVAVDNIK